MLQCRGTAALSALQMFLSPILSSPPPPLLPPARPLPSLPERRTDGSRVVSTATDLVTLMAVKGGHKLIKR